MNSAQQNITVTSCCRCPGGRRPPPRFAPTGLLSPSCQWSRAAPADAAALGRPDPSNSSPGHPRRTNPGDQHTHVVAAGVYLTFPQSRHQAQCHGSEPGGADQCSEVLQDHGGAELQQRGQVVRVSPDWSRLGSST